MVYLNFLFELSQSSGIVLES